MELWKIIFGYRGRYEVSNMGNIRSNFGLKVKVLKQTYGNNGYFMISLRKKNGVKTNSIHRLVAKAFISNPRNKPQVNHKNGVKYDNRVENLEWVTAKENVIHSVKLGLKKKQPRKLIHGINHPMCKKILQFNKKGDFIKEWESGTYAGESIKINKGDISSCLNLKRKSAGGFIWKYK